jgi:hypothetical protein
VEFQYALRRLRLACKVGYSLVVVVVVAGTLYLLALAAAEIFERQQSS